MNTAFLDIRRFRHIVGACLVECLRWNGHRVFLVWIIFGIELALVSPFPLICQYLLNPVGTEKRPAPAQSFPAKSLKGIIDEYAPT